MRIYADQLFVDYKGRVWLSLLGERVRVGRVFRQGSRWKFMDAEHDGDGVRYKRRAQAVGALARWIS